MSCVSILAAVSEAPAVWGVLATFGGIGLLAMMYPRWFHTLAVRSNQWIDTNKLLALLDRRVDIDHYVLPYSRSLGVAVVAAVTVMGLLYARYGG